MEILHCEPPAREPEPDPIDPADERWWAQNAPYRDLDWCPQDEELPHEPTGADWEDYQRVVCRPQ